MKAKLFATRTSIPVYILTPASCLSIMTTLYDPSRIFGYSTAVHKAGSMETTGLNTVKLVSHLQSTELSICFYLRHVNISWCTLTRQHSIPTHLHYESLHGSVTGLTLCITDINGINWCVYVSCLVTFIEAHLADFRVTKYLTSYARDLCVQRKRLHACNLRRNVSPNIMQFPCLVGVFAQKWKAPISFVTSVRPVRLPACINSASHRPDLRQIW